MQEIRRGKQQRSRAYHSALADRGLLPRLLRLLDLRLADALGAMVAESLVEAVAAMCAVAAGEGAGGAGAVVAAPALLCSVVLSAGSCNGGGSIAFSPSQGEWMAVLEAELVDGPHQMAASLPPLLARPVFQCYQEALGAGTKAAALPAAGESSPWQAAGGLALEGSEFSLAAAELRTLLQQSFEEAERVARQQYHQYAAVVRWLDNFEFEAWAAEQR